MFDELTPPYSTIVADPPWHYDRGSPPVPAGGRNPNGYKGAELPYSSMTLDEIKALPVAHIAAADARLYLWVTNRYLRHAWDVVEAWGFEPLSRSFVWCKKPMATMSITTEYVVVGKRGKPPQMPWHGTTWFDWDRPCRTHHSRKPEAFLDLIESWSPGPYVEMFARQSRLGWDSWGYGYEIGESA